MILKIYVQVAYVLIVFYSDNSNWLVVLWVIWSKDDLHGKQVKRKKKLDMWSYICSRVRALGFLMFSVLYPVMLCDAAMEVRVLYSLVNLVYKLTHDIKINRGSQPRLYIQIFMVSLDIFLNFINLLLVSLQILFSVVFFLLFSTFSLQYGPLFYSCLISDHQPLYCALLWKIGFQSYLDVFILRCSVFFCFFIWIASSLHRHQHLK